MKNRDDTDGGRVTPTFDKLSDAIAAIVPLAIGYFAGIMYIGTYLSRFGISIHEIEIGLPIVISYSFNVFSSPYFLILFIGVTLFAYSFSLAKISDSMYPEVIESLKSGIAHILIVVLVFLFIFVIIGKIAKLEAREDADKVWSGNAASITFRGPMSQHDFVISERVKLEFQRCKTLDQMRHILTTASRVYAACPATKKYGIIFIQDRQTGNFTELRELER